MANSVKQDPGIPGHPKGGLESHYVTGPVAKSDTALVFPTREPSSSAGVTPPARKAARNFKAITDKDKYAVDETGGALCLDSTIITDGAGRHVDDLDLLMMSSECDAWLEPHSFLDDDEFLSAIGGVSLPTQR
jgi:hypothetical protein